MTKAPEEVPVRDLLEKQSLRLELVVGEDGLSTLIETPNLRVLHETHMAITAPKITPVDRLNFGRQRQR